MAATWHPPERTCMEHGPNEITFYETGGVVRGYCRACRRQREAKRHYGGPRCHLRGHLKTPWSWRRYKSGWRCLPCQYARDRERRRERAQLATAS